MKSPLVTYLTAREAELRGAFALLTRLPQPSPSSARHGAAAVWAYPLVGAVIGAIAGAVGVAGLAMGLAPMIAAGLALGAGILVTGALHEDGLADTADGFWGGWTPARRLEIMRDSQIGSYGVLALILAMLLQWSALVHLAQGPGFFWALILAGSASRAALLLPMAGLPHARHDGLSHRTGRPPRGAMAAAAAWAVLFAAMLGGPGLWAGVFAIAAAFALTALARHKIGGQTGDVLGATQKISEIVILLALSATLGAVQ